MFKWLLSKTKDIKSEPKPFKLGCVDKYHEDVVVSKKYTAEDYNNDERFENYQLEPGCTRDTYLYIFDEYDNEIALLEGFTYKKKACLACNTCLDEYEEGANKILNEIKKHELKEVRKRRVDEICGGE